MDFPSFVAEFLPLGRVSMVERGDVVEGRIHFERHPSVVGVFLIVYLVLEP